MTESDSHDRPGYTEPPGRPTWAHVWDPWDELPLWRSQETWRGGPGHLNIEQFSDGRLGPQIVYTDQENGQSRFTIDQARQFAQDIVDLCDRAEAG